MANDDLFRTQSRRVYWIQAVQGLWTPVTVFLFVLIPYIILVELKTDAYHWAQPLVKAFGLLMVLWFVGLLIARFALPKVSKLRRLRHDARELLDELEGVLRRRGKSISPEVRAQLLEGAEKLDAARVQGDSAALERELIAFNEAMQKRLGSLRKQHPALIARDLVVWIFFALMVRAVLIEPYKIPSGSMIPTLAIGDQIFVNKFIYGVRIPYLNKVPFVIGRVPKRGDVVVFNNPVNPELDFIKRVVGIPGDHVEIRNEVVFINGVEQTRELLSADETVWDYPTGLDRWVEDHRRLYRETLDGLPHPVLQQPGGVRAPHEGEYIVPEAQVFVMGDNRDNSSDSRMDLGGPDRGQVAYVPYGHIKGKAMIIWLSLSHGGVLGNLFGGTGLRTDRLFLPVR